MCVSQLKTLSIIHSKKVFFNGSFVLMSTAKPSSVTAIRVTTHLEVANDD